MTLFSNIKLAAPSFLMGLLFLSVSCGGGSTSSSSEDSFLFELNEIASVEEGEENSGGTTTVRVDTGKAFGQPAANLNSRQEGDFKFGNSFFEQAWVKAPASTTARDGLGPLFNETACSSCHQKDGRARPPEEENHFSGLLLRLSIPGETANGSPKPDPNYGDQLQDRALLDLDAEGKIEISYQEIPGQYADGTSYSLRKPIYNIVDLAYGELSEDIMISPRIAQQLPGLGLLEAIAEEDILALEDLNDDDGDGISGKANFVWDVRANDFSLGRFGWKANSPTVEQQAAAAFLGDVGVTSPLFSEENCMESQLECQNLPHGGVPEVEGDIFDSVVFYSKTLAVPARRNWDRNDVLRGKKLFRDSSCISCHVDQHQTASDYPITALAGQTIRPYTDLLLHDMGEGLADNRPDFLANGREWKTPPLWGIGLIEKVNGHTFFLHDGRARNLEEAILWHGGEAEASKEAFRKMEKRDRDALIAFLESL